MSAFFIIVVALFISALSFALIKKEEDLGKIDWKRTGRSIGIVALSIIQLALFLYIVVIFTESIR